MCGRPPACPSSTGTRSEEHTSELQSHHDIVCRLLLEKKTARVARFSSRQEILGYMIFVNQPANGKQSRAMSSAVSNAWLIQPRRTPTFFFNDTATTEIYTLSLHDALPI